METTISDQLRQIIRDSAVTQAQLSRALGVTKGAISRFLSGSSISMEMMDKIGGFFEVKLMAQGEQDVSAYIKPIGRPTHAIRLSQVIKTLEQHPSLTQEQVAEAFEPVWGAEVAHELAAEAFALRQSPVVPKE